MAYYCPTCKSTWFGAVPKHCPTDGTLLIDDDPEPDTPFLNAMKILGMAEQIFPGRVIWKTGNEIVEYWPHDDYWGIGTYGYSISKLSKETAALIFHGLLARAEHDKR